MPKPADTSKKLSKTMSKYASQMRLDIAHLTTLGLKLFLPVACLILVLSDLSPLAIVLVLISKWRVLAVKPRYWALNLRANMVDVVVGLSLVAFMDYSRADAWAILAWFGAFVFWIIYVRNLSTYVGMLAQALLALSLGVSAVVYSSSDVPLWIMVFSSWFIAYFSARHVLNVSAHDDAALLATAWATFAAQLAWVLGHWQVWFWVVHQLVFLLVVIGLTLALMYSHDKEYGLKSQYLRLISVSSGTIVLAVLLLSDWTDKTL